MSWWRGIIISGSTIEEVYETLNFLDKILLSWVESNGLAINVKKTKTHGFLKAAGDKRV